MVGACFSSTRSQKQTKRWPRVILHCLDTGGAQHALSCQEGSLVQDPSHSAGGGSDAMHYVGTESSSSAKVRDVERETRRLERQNELMRQQLDMQNVATSFLCIAIVTMHFWLSRHDN